MPDLRAQIRQTFDSHRGTTLADSLARRPEFADGITVTAGGHSYEVRHGVRVYPAAGWGNSDVKINWSVFLRDGKNMGNWSDVDRLPHATQTDRIALYHEADTVIDALRDALAAKRGVPAPQIEHDLSHSRRPAGQVSWALEL